MSVSIQINSASVIIREEIWKLAWSVLRKGQQRDLFKKHTLAYLVSRGTCGIWAMCALF